MKKQSDQGVPASEGGRSTVPAGETPSVHLRPHADEQKERTLCEILWHEWELCRPLSGSTWRWQCKRCHKVEVVEERGKWNTILGYYQ